MRERPLRYLQRAVKPDHNYPVKVSKAQLRKMKEWWVTYKLLTDNYWKQIDELESDMQYHVGITGVEFVHPDNQGAVGIGNKSRTMKLIQHDELEG